MFNIWDLKGLDVSPDKKKLFCERDWHDGFIITAFIKTVRRLLPATVSFVRVLC